MTTVADVLNGKGQDIWSISPDSSVFDAISLMAEKGIGALLVMSDDRLAGIVSERDYARKVILQGHSAEETPVRVIMTADVVTVHPDQTVDRCLALMTEKRFRHLPVVDGDRVVGILSIGDLVKSSLADKERLIEQLERYITGGR
ncbi:MAG TPA: CBS domain-containing protein [Chloroflexota bacterium]